MFDCLILPAGAVVVTSEGPVGRVPNGGMNAVVGFVTVLKYHFAPARRRCEFLPRRVAAEQTPQQRRRHVMSIIAATPPTSYLMAYRVAGNRLTGLWQTEIDYGHDGQPKGIESIHMPSSGDLLILGDRRTSNLVLHNPLSGAVIGCVLLDTALHGGHNSWLDITDAIDSVNLADGGYRVIPENVWCQNQSIYDFRLPKSNSLEP